MELNDLKIAEIPLASADDEDLGDDSADGNDLTNDNEQFSKFESATSPTNSLEDLVGGFESKIAQCFRDYEEKAEDIAPVQIRTQEEIMKECQVWWTITGNFGNMLPIDWNKSTARQNQLSALHLKAPLKQNIGAFGLGEMGDTGDEEELRNDLDMHQLIISSDPDEFLEPLATADDVIKEINDMLDESSPEQDEISLKSLDSSSKPIIDNPISDAKNSPEYLSSQSIAWLSSMLSDLEELVRENSEELVAYLGHRDELEYEKELRNTFISLLLSVQNKKRRVSHAGSTGVGSKYLTTVIPYDLSKEPLSIEVIQVLVKILKAISEDSPAVPALLTDYILKVLCPS